MILDIDRRAFSYLRPMLFLRAALYGDPRFPFHREAMFTRFLGLFLVLFEIVTFQKRPRSMSLVDRVYEKVWLRVGATLTHQPKNPVDIRIHNRSTILTLI